MAVTDSVHLLKKLKFDSIFVDEAHHLFAADQGRHPLPPKMPRLTQLYRFSATHKDEPDFSYTTGRRQSKIGFCATARSRCQP